MNSKMRIKAKKKAFACRRRTVGTCAYLDALTPGGQRLTTR